MNLQTRIGNHAVRFGTTPPQPSDPTAVLYGRLNGMKEALEKGDLKVLDVKFPQNFSVKNMDEAFIQATLQKGNTVYELHLSGNMSGHSFSLKSTDGQTSYRYENQCGEMDINCADTRGHKPFNYGQKADLHIAPSHKMTQLNAMAAEVRQGFVKAIKAFYENPPKTLEETPPDTDF